MLEDLPVITPRPRINLVLYYGLLAPRAGWRAAIVGDGAIRASGEYRSAGDPPACSWAELLRRAFDFDVLACPRCGRAMRLIAPIEHAEAIRRILRHLGQRTEVPAAAPARAPPPLDLVRGGPEHVEGPLIAEGGMSPRADNARVIVYDREPTPDYDDPC